MDDESLSVPKEQIMNHFQILFQIISGVPAHFVYNMDEMGHQIWQIRQERSAIFPNAVMMI